MMKYYQIWKNKKKKKRNKILEDLKHWQKNKKYHLN